MANKKKYTVGDYLEIGVVISLAIVVVSLVITIKPDIKQAEKDDQLQIEKQHLVKSLVQTNLSWILSTACTLQKAGKLQNDLEGEIRQLRICRLALSGNMPFHGSTKSTLLIKIRDQDAKIIALKKKLAGKCGNSGGVHFFNLH